MSSEFDLAYKKAVAFLAKLDRFETEVRMHLHAFETETVDEVLSRLKAKGILDDSRAAAGFSENRKGRKAVGSVKLGQSLEQRGVDSSIIEATLSGRDERSNALGALKGKFAPLAANRARGYRFLLSRGFDYEVSGQAVDEFFENNVDIVE